MRFPSSLDEVVDWLSEYSELYVGVRKEECEFREPNMIELQCNSPGLNRRIENAQRKEVQLNLHPEIMNL